MWRAAIIAGILVLAGCTASRLPQPTPATAAGAATAGAVTTSPAPSAASGWIDAVQCSAFGLGPRRCRAIGRAAAAQVDAPPSRTIAGMELIPPPTPEPGTLAKGGGWTISVRVRFTDGGEATAAVGCGGIGQERRAVCTENPVLELGSVTMGGGYHDVPCANENGDGCGIALPAITAAARQAAVPLRVPVRDIPIDHVGPYRVDLGRVTLPNGILTTARGRVGDDRPAGYIVNEGSVSLRLYPAVAGRPPFDNYYTHGWWPGTEAADVTVEFSIDEFEPGATLQLRDVVVE